MAAKDRVKIIEQAKRDYEAAKKKGDKAAMAKAHADADKARGYATETVVSNGKLVQTKQGLTPKNVELAKANAPKPIPYAPKRQEKIPVLGDMFDQKENYVDKFKKGNIGGGVANFVGTGLTGLQSLYLNTFNRIDSLRQGEGIPDTVPMMSYADYEKAVADRAGVKPISEKVSDFNPLLGGVYKMGMEIGTDPLELTPVGFLNDIKVAKGAAAGSDAYNMALQAGKLPGGTTGIPVNDNYKVNQPRPIPRAVQTKADEVIHSPKGNTQAVTLDEYLGQKGLSSPISDYTIDKMRLPHGETARQQAKRIKEGNKAADEYQNARASAIKEYKAKIENGEIRDKTRLEKTMETAQGHPDNESVQAARRILEKKGIDWKTGEAIQPIPQAPNRPVQPVKSVPQWNVPPMAETPKFQHKDLGADTFKGEKTIEQLSEEFGSFKPGELPRARDVQIPKKTDYGDVQQYARTLQESAIVDDNLFKEINDAITDGTFTKTTKANKVALDDANSFIDGKGLDESLNTFKSVLKVEKQPTSYDIAMGNRLIQDLQKTGRYQDALDVAVDLSQMLSESGRTLQAARIAKRLSPEGRTLLVARAAEKVTKRTGQKVKLSDDVLEQIKTAKTEDEIAKANQAAALEMWNQVPANWLDKMNSWRYTAMLFNPKTHVRNIVGNALFVPAREFKNLIGTGLEKAIIKEGDKTKAVLTPKDKDLLEFAGKDFENVKSVLKNEGKIDDKIRPQEAKVFDTKALEAIRKFNLNTMDAEDTWFMKFAYDSSLAQWMKANNIKPADMVGDTLERGRKYAMNESLKATYRDFNSLSNFIARTKSNLSRGDAGWKGHVGAVALEGAIPFAKTPLNIIKRGVAYSPAGLVRGIANLKNVSKGKITATEAIDQLASGLSGTALLGLGTFLGYQGIVKGKDGEYKDKGYQYNQMLGSQNYSLVVDGKSYTLDWAAPLSMPFFVGVELSKAFQGQEADITSVLDAMTKISDPMVNLSMLKGINDLLTNNFEGVGQTLMDLGTGYAGQYNPTLFGQVARTVDPVRRSTTSTEEKSLNRQIERFGRKQLAKIPVVSKGLQPYVDMWGREQKNGGIVENFLSPGYFKEENITPVDKEILALTEKLDEETAKDIIPPNRSASYTITSNSIPYRMNEKELTEFAKVSGQEAFNGLEKLFSTSSYREMGNEQKAKAIKSVYDDAYQKAKYNYFDKKGLPVTLALPKAQQEKFSELTGITDKEYFEGYTTQSGFPTDIRKAVALNDIDNPKLYEVFDISKKSVTTAKALAEKGLVDAYDKTYPKLKGIESKPGMTESAQKRKIIKEMNPDLGMLEIALLYRAFNI